ncbi:cytochrome b5-like heme/steroid binding domain-containing protein [Chytriomyces sp. MP71]|nr:cytochrome b5-like heme/steroid binding domain-containing protein [Chytriomyces sp. MP71]
MVDIRERKKASPGTASSTAGSKAGIEAADKKAKKSGGSSALVSFAIVLAVITVATLASSFVLTKSLTFGYDLNKLRKHVPRKIITLTTAELKGYDGTDPSKPVYLAINGRVYDVTAGREKYYGPNGGYKFFSGVDAARAYITGCFQTHLTHDLRGLSQAEIDSLSQWSDFYEKHDTYFYVGEVVHDPIPEDAPLPEPCM